MHLICRKALQYFRSIENQVKAMDSARTFNAFGLYNIQTMKKRDGHAGQKNVLWPPLQSKVQVCPWIKPISAIGGLSCTELHGQVETHKAFERFHAWSQKNKKTIHQNSRPWRCSLLLVLVTSLHAFLLRDYTQPHNFGMVDSGHLSFHKRAKARGWKQGAEVYLSQRDVQIDFTQNRHARPRS